MSPNVFQIGKAAEGGLGERGKPPIWCYTALFRLSRLEKKDKSYKSIYTGL